MQDSVGVCLETGGPGVSHLFFQVKVMLEAQLTDPSRSLLRCSLPGKCCVRACGRSPTKGSFLEGGCGVTCEGCPVMTPMNKASCPSILRQADGEACSRIFSLQFSPWEISVTVIVALMPYNL